MTRSRVCVAAATLLATVVLTAGASASFNVTDEHTGQTFSNFAYDTTPYACAAPCAFTFTPLTNCFGNGDQFRWWVRDANDQIVYETGAAQLWHYDFTAPSSYSVAEIENSSSCGTGGMFRLQVLDKTPPETTITAGPAALTNDVSPTFTFASSELGSSFACGFDGAAIIPCSSPMTSAPLANGDHSFAVAATDPAGNTDPTPAVLKFHVVRLVPLESILRQGWTHHGRITGVALLQLRDSWLTVSPGARARR